ncbi:response regulator [Candidatus Saganbacteria bacterium]|uniref:Response regulator n=1 Tax=Candidatus Saganbacteria bacterium TaxID=2575572 RepID=A0A9D6UJW9_UNCSA|nr:response regulator [Candidatus Saganbacteria bacterium]
MRNLTSPWIKLAFVFCLLQISVVFAQAPAGITSEREYLPGDFVHVIVDAPLETAQITATMPDGTVISLVQERVTGVWRGIWQVPVKFKKGAYYAKLSAVDLSGKVFEGRTDSFEVGELALITLVGKPTVEAPKRETFFRQLITVEAPAAAVGQKELLKMIKEIVTPKVVVPPLALKPEEKAILVEKNLIAGKGALANGMLMEAAAYFRNVLFLSPDHQEAGQYLAETQQKIAREENQRQNSLMVAATILIVVFGSALISFVVASLLARRKVPLPEQPKPLSLKGKKEHWYKNLGWTKDPFAPDDFQQLFSNYELESGALKNFIKMQIEKAGGKDGEPFSAAAMEEIYRLSKGKVSSAVKICGWTVNRSIEEGEEKVTAELVLEYQKTAVPVILIAEDEEVVSASLDAILKKGGGYETDFAFDGEETIRKIKEKKYNLVLLDIEMPKVDGYEVLKRVRSSYPDLPIIFVTGGGEPQKTLESLSQYKLSGYIEKPFTVEKVLDMVAKTLK